MGKKLDQAGQSVHPEVPAIWSMSLVVTEAFNLLQRQFYIPSVPLPSVKYPMNE